MSRATPMPSTDPRWSPARDAARGAADRRACAVPRWRCPCRSAATACRSMPQRPSSQRRRSPVRLFPRSTAGWSIPVQPSAMRWFNPPVVEIRQISAYSCRGMNGQIDARISEHAFGNALDIASFTLADGRQGHGQGRLARPAGRAGLSARCAGGGLRSVHHRAGAGLEPSFTTTTSMSI